MVQSWARLHFKEMQVTNEILAMFPVKGKETLDDLMKRIELKTTDLDDHPFMVKIKLLSIKHYKSDAFKFCCSASLYFVTEIEGTKIGHWGQEKPLQGWKAKNTKGLLYYLSYQN